MSTFLWFVGALAACIAGGFVMVLASRVMDRANARRMLVRYKHLRVVRRSCRRLIPGIGLEVYMVGYPSLHKGAPSLSIIELGGLFSLPQYRNERAVRAAFLYIKRNGELPPYFGVMEGP